MSNLWTSTHRLLTTALLLTSLVFGMVEAVADDATRLGNHTIERTLQLRTHCLYAPYIDQDLQNRWWDFGADAYVNTAKHVRLTRNVRSQMGWLWSRLAFTTQNFVIEVEFKISGDSSHLYGDGLALWLTTDRAQPGPVFGSKDEFNGLGIFLDTYSNAQHSYAFPRIVGVLGDGKTKYEYGTDGDEQAIGGCSANFRRTNVITKLKVTYIRDGFLDVKVQYKAWDEWMDCFYIDKIKLPKHPFLGFSAMTGDVSDAHDIVSVTSYSVILSQPNSPPNKFGRGKNSESSSNGTWSGFFFKLVLFGGVCAGGYYGWQEYQRRQRLSEFGLGDSYGMNYPGSAMRSAGLGPGPYGLKSAGVDSGSAYGLRSAGVNDGGTYGPRSAGINDGGIYGPRSAGVNDGGTYGPRSAGVNDGGTYGLRSAGVNDGGAYGMRSAGLNDGPYGPKSASANNGSGGVYSSKRL